MLDCVLDFKGESKKLNKKNVEHNLYLIAHNGFEFDSYEVLKLLPQWWIVVKVIKNGRGIVSLEKFNVCVDKDKKKPQNVHLGSGRVHLGNSLKKVGESYKLQAILMKQEIDHDEIYEDTCEEKENEWLGYVKNDVLSTVFCYARYTKGLENWQDLVWKKSLTLPSLANRYPNCFGDKTDELIYTYNYDYKRYFVRKSIKRGRCTASNQNCESIISDNIFDIISEELNVHSNIIEILDEHFKNVNIHRDILET